MINRREGMIYKKVWLSKDEMANIKIIKDKEVTKENLQEIGDMFLTAIKRGDFI